MEVSCHRAQALPAPRRSHPALYDVDNLRQVVAFFWALRGKCALLARVAIAIATQKHRVFSYNLDQRGRQFQGNPVCLLMPITGPADLANDHDV